MFSLSLSWLLSWFAWPGEELFRTSLYHVQCSWPLPLAEVFGGSKLHGLKHPTEIFKYESFFPLALWAVRVGRGALAFPGLFIHVNCTPDWIALSLHWPHRETRDLCPALGIKHQMTTNWLSVLSWLHFFFLSSYIYSFNHFIYCLCSFYDLSLW